MHTEEAGGHYATRNTVTKILNVDFYRKHHHTIRIDAETSVPSVGPDWKDVVGPPGAGSPTPLEVLAGHGVEAASEEAARPSARESPRIYAATKILETEEDTPSEEEELVLRVDRCLRGYARWEIAARERMTLRELEMRATALMVGDGQSRR
ncbi:hypothetical protein AXG93_2894s1000 [Marchantia polymorpha subsp. ruderalis]|uniref:Uncharacterized protein n=1 Tax=Marchantia polymorpha subsp. ruderalis TaxID=1480154 RepID=A0A176WFQ4_MARPO|nr:hypothetical protein AXG93_2894s1000 [Marchantia polymorpha subsp. ruderalis]